MAVRASTSSPLNTHYGGNGMDKMAVALRCCRRALKAKVIRRLLSPFIVERGGGMEWYCCKWPLPLLFCYNNDNFIAFQPLSLSLPKEAKCSTERAFSFYLALGRAWNAFSASKNIPQVLSSLFDASISHVTLRWNDPGLPERYPSVISSSLDLQLNPQLVSEYNYSHPYPPPSSASGLSDVPKVLLRTF